VRKAVRILGTRGIPAAHSGFETFGEHLALGLVARGWEVTVYCQQRGRGPLWDDVWRGVRRTHIPVRGSDSAASVLFDLRSTLHAAPRGELALVLGYNTALFSAWYRLKKVPNIINMDGMDRLRPKWRFPIRQFFALNEALATRLADHLIADHPAIAEHHLARAGRERITMIPYGADRVDSADPAIPSRYGLEAGRYVLVVCRPESGHSLTAIVRAFSRKRRPVKLALLGRYDPARNAYHRRLVSAASPDVVFPGAVFEKPRLESLRFHARLYIHGHRFGGTNPSLVEALGAGSPVLARDNVYNRWVAGEGACYFRDEDDCARELDRLLDSEDELARMAAASRRRHAEEFVWEAALSRYEELLLRWLPAAAVAGEAPALGG
jgi:glycosyltransferase involved in cell wall biosynthesis